MPRIEDFTEQFRSQSSREEVIDDIITKVFGSKNYQILMFNFLGMLYAYVYIKRLFILKSNAQDEKRKKICGRMCE